MTAQWKKDEPTIPTGACTGSYGSQRSVNLAVNGVENFDYTGNVVCAYLQKAGYYKLEVWGAQGGSAIGYSYGGYSMGNVFSDANSALYVVVGGKGSIQTSTGGAGGGYNGGGNGYTTYASSTWNVGGGGGATHISVQNCGELKNCSSYKGTYDSSKGTYDGGKILIVAGGGGGMGYRSSGTFEALGGAGGGYLGSVGHRCRAGCSFAYPSNQSTSDTEYPVAYTAGGGQNDGYSFGLGKSAPSSVSRICAGGGGGGWYGGGANQSANCNERGGGGGSGYIGNSMLLQSKEMYTYNYGTLNDPNYSPQYPESYGTWTDNGRSSTSIHLKTTYTTSTGHAQQNKVNTGNGYAKITYLGTSI